MNFLFNIVEDFGMLGLLAILSGFVASIIFIVVLIKKLPARLRGFVQKLATTLFIFAVFRYLFHEHFALIALKTSILLYVFSAVTSIAFAFMLLLLSYQTLGFERIIERMGIAPIKKVIRIKQFDKDATYTSSYLYSSPIMLE